jgi:UTP--glucose-1-phosphate uridylyltransferase
MKPSAPVTKAVFPVAGMGTRFLPITKASPKEMLPVVDKPLIQYATDEAIAAGLTQLIFVTGRHKRSIEDHYDKAYELEAELAARGKHELLQALGAILPPPVTCAYTRQSETRGLGHAVLCARSLVGTEPFAVLLADDLIHGNPPDLLSMIELYRRTGCSVLGVQRIPRAETRHYGVIEGSLDGEGVWNVRGVVEKPRPEEAPSELAIAGRYLLTPRIFDCLARTTPGAGGEIQLTDAIGELLRHERVLAWEFKGRRYDCGSKLGYLQATVETALRHPAVGQAFRDYLRGLKP